MGSLRSWLAGSLGASAIVALSAACVDVGSLSGGQDGAPDAARSDGGEVVEAGQAGEAGANVGPDGGTDLDAADAALGCGGALDCERVAFVTSTQYTGDLGGTAGADAHCQERANASGVARVRGRTFRAWISSSSDSAATRLPHGTKSYIRTDGVVVASSWAGLTGGGLSAPLDVDENGTPIADGVWTATYADGTPAGANCSDWVSASPAIPAGTGDTTALGVQWTFAGATACNVPRHLYCIEY